MLVEQIIREVALLAGRTFIQFTGGLTARAAIRQLAATALTYGPNIALDASAANAFVVTVTDAVAFAINAPTNPPGSTFRQLLMITVSNTSGGAAGVGTWNAIFKTDSGTNVLPAIATGKQRTFQFLWNGTNWVEIAASAADVAN